MLVVYYLTVSNDSSQGSCGLITITAVRWGKINSTFSVHCCGTGIINGSDFGPLQTATLSPPADGEGSPCSASTWRMFPMFLVLVCMERSKVSGFCWTGLMRKASGESADLWPISYFYAPHMLILVFRAAAASLNKQ